MYNPDARGYEDDILHLTIPYNVIPPTFLTHNAENVYVIKAILIEKQSQRQKIRD